MKTLRVWGISCPDTDGEELYWRYRLWFWLYKNNQKFRHYLGLHQKPTHYSIAPRCDWCGFINREQREIADRNWRLEQDAPSRTLPPPADSRPENP